MTNQSVDQQGRRHRTWPNTDEFPPGERMEASTKRDILQLEITNRSPGTEAGCDETTEGWISGVYRVDAEDTVVSPNRLAARHEETVVQRDELAARNAHLERVDAEKTKLLQTVAHDLRNPLGVVLGYARLLESEADTLPTEEVRRIARALERNGAFMRRLIDDLLDLASIEAGAFRLSPRETDTVELARQCVAVQQVIASSKSIRIRLEAAEGVPPIEVDRERFEQALGNLLSNAVKYSPPGGEVRVGVYREGDDVLFDVVDEGRGIAPELLPRIFEPFTRGDACGTAGEKSTGLGLAIAKEMVDAHGGQIAVSSARGHGSTFTVRVPACPDARAR